jgi:hypothetical protein
MLKNPATGSKLKVFIDNTSYPKWPKSSLAACVAEGGRNLELIIVFGLILFSEPPGDLSRATLHVHLLDTTLADDTSVTLAEQDIVSPKPDRTAWGGIRFCLPETQIDRRGYYEVWVHVDMDQSGDISPGDFLSTESYPVPIKSGEVEMQVKVTRI